MPLQVTDQNNRETLNQADTRQKGLSAETGHQAVHMSQREKENGRFWPPPENTTKYPENMNMPSQPQFWVIFLFYFSVGGGQNLPYSETSAGRIAALAVSDCVRVGH